LSTVVKSLTAARQRQIFTSNFFTTRISLMLKPVLIVVVLLTVLPSLQQQTVERADPDLAVVKFSWAKEKQKSSVIRGRGPIGTPISNASDLGSRKTDMRVMEQKAAISAIESPGPSYQLRLEVKNTGRNVVRSLIWQFKPSAGPADYEPKHYLCALQVKPKEKKLLEVWTHYAPVKVISVDERSDALKDGEVVINKIEYTDGSVWTRPGWLYKLPPDASKKLSEGSCSVF
jgi:hypothetical protein